MQFRIDSLPNEQKLFWEKTAHGYVAFATLAKIGHELKYLSDDGTGGRTEFLRNFSEDSIASVRGMPLCLGHPESGTYQGNRSGAAIGHFLQEIIISDAGELLAPVTITDKRGIDLIEDCLQRGVSPEISPAYWVESVEKTDTDEFTQNRGRYDHAALLLPGKGRGGAVISLRLDHTDTIQIETMATPPTDTAKLEEATIKLQQQIETLTGENAGLKAQLESTETTHLSLDSINARLSTIARIGGLNLDSIDIKTSAAVMQKQHIAKLNPAIDLTGKSDEYVAGMFDTLCSQKVPEAIVSDSVNKAEAVAESPPSGNVDKTVQQLAGTRSDSISGDPIAVAKQRRLAQIESGTS